MESQNNIQITPNQKHTYSLDKGDIKIFWFVVENNQNGYPK